MYTVPFVIISCWLFGSVYSASLFGVDFTAPAKVANTGVREISQVIKPQPPQYSNFPFGKSTQENNQFSDTHIPIKDDHGPASKKVSESIPQKTNQNTDVVSKQESDDYTPDLSETGINDYTTETLDYETTTSEPLNRIGGAPPAVVASLLG